MTRGPRPCAPRPAAKIRAMSSPLPNPLHPRLAEAVAYAAIVHADQGRKGSAVPYLAHLLQVAGLAMEHGADPEAQLAAILHDAAEDRGGRARLADIRQRFGERVAALVEACSDALPDPEQPAKPPWRERKQRYLARLAEPATDPAALLIALADKVHNARCLLADLRHEGARAWQRFHAGCAEHCWYWEACAELAERRGVAPALVAELRRLRDAVRQASGDAG